MSLKKPMLIRMPRAFLFALTLCSVLAAGCSKEMKKSRFQKQADQHFQAGQFDKAEIEYLRVLNLDRQNKNAVGRLASIYYDEGRLPQAMAFLLEAKKIDPDNFELREKLGTLYVSARLYKEARQEALYVLAKKPASAQALLVLVDAVAATNDLIEARQQLEKLKPQIENTAAFHLALASLALRQKDTNAALAALQQAAAIDPKSGAVNGALGQYYLRRNDLAKAEQHLKAAAENAPPRSPWRLQYIDFKLATGDQAFAKRALEEITAQAPDLIPAWIRLAKLAQLEKRSEDFAKVIQKVLLRDHSNYEALVLDARQRLAAGETAKAVAELERLVQYYPKLPPAYYELALAHLRNNDLNKSIASLNQAVSLDPNLPEPTLLLAELYLRKSDHGSAIILLNRLIKNQPQIAQAYLLLAAAHRLRNDLPEAVTVYRRLIERFPQNPQPQVLLGLACREQGNTNEARLCFEKALQLAPDHLGAIEQLVLLDVEQQQIPRAINRAQALAEKLPKAPEPLLILAGIYKTQTNFTRTEATLLKALELQADYRPAHLMLAQLYVGANQFRQALDKYQNLTAKNPQDTVAWMQTGMIQNELKNYPAARDAYEAILKINPNSGPALNNLAYLYSENFKQLDQATTLARRARELAPFDPYAADTLGWILVKRGDYPWALSLLQESAEKLPAEPEVLYHLGIAHYLMGEAEPSRLALERSLRPAKDFPGKTDAQQRLAWLTTELQASGPQAVAKFEQRLAENPDDPILLGRLAELYEQGGAAEKAARAYEAAIKRNPKNVTALVKLAQFNADRLNNPARAIELAKNAYSLAPDDPSVSHTLGRLALQSGDHQWALSLLQQSVQKLPNHPGVLVDYARAQACLGRLAEARATMQTVLPLAASPPQAEAAKQFLALAPLCLASQPVQPVLPQIQQALKADTNCLPALYLSALLSEQQNHPQMAQTAYEAILARFPFFTPAQKRLADLYVAAGDLAKAFAIAQKIRQALPEDPQTAKTLGVIVYKRGDYSRAVQLLKEASRPQTSDPDLYYYLGMAHYRLKQKKESAEALRQAVALKPNASFVPEVNRILAESK